MKTVEDLTLKAAGLYLQSAVFIDDQIFSVASGKPLEKQEIVMPRVRKPTFSRTQLASESTTPPAGTMSTSSALSPMPESVEETYVFHPKEIVGSFAQKGIVCALYEPAPDFKTDEDSEIFKICQAADLVVLDWDFHKDDGAKMRELVTNLVAQSNKTIPHHSRLVVIYTTTPSLQKVASSLFDRLNEAGLKSQALSKGLRQDVEATRIVVLGKASIERGEEEVGFTVQEKDLAERVIKEFVLKNQGILSASALIAMGAVKRNSRRILAKFNADMDGAFLLHRALLLHTDDAFESIPVLIAEEFQAVVEDHFAKLGDLTQIVEKRAATLEIRAPKVAWTKDAGTNEKGNKITKLLSNAEFQGVTQAFLNRGVEGLKDHRGCVEVKKLSEDARSITRAPEAGLIRVLRDAVDANDSKTNERLAALFNSRTYYEQQIRFLTLGTVVRLFENEKSEYSLCIVPVCDGVRLRKDTAVDFPFLRFHPGGFGTRGGNGCVIEDSTGQLIELVAITKIRNMHIERFSPQGMEGVILAKKNGEGFWMKADNGKSYEWIGQLKPAHAQRIAHAFGQALSRVGLSEAEWVRLLCDRD